MKLSDFILLDINEKKHAVMHQGVLIAKRTSSREFIFLFQMDHFYVEAFCNLSDKQVGEFRASADTALLMPYLDAIALDDLVN